MNGFIHSILDGIHWAVVVLGPQLEVEMWNGASTDLWGLPESEVEGRAFLSLDIILPVQALRDEMSDCLEGSSDGVRLTLDGLHRTGKPMTFDIRRAPLHRQDDEIRGVVHLVRGRSPEDGD